MSPEYLAGLFDGEGCIDVQRVKCTTKGYADDFYVRPRLRMAMAANCRPLGDMLHKEFGGHIYDRKAQKEGQQASWSIEWLSRFEMRRILRLILPSLRLKREQALLISWWLSNATGRGWQSGFPGITQGRLAFVEELSAMKRDPQRLSERAIERISQLMR